MVTDEFEDSWIWFFQVKLRRPFEPKAFRAAREGLLEACGRQGVYEDQAWDLAAAADELLCNVLEHSDAAWLDLGACQEATQGTLRLRLIDNGRRFDVAAEAAKIPKKLPADQEWHLGLAMLSGIGKAMSYRELPEGGNELTLSLA
jgi:anti-sigma regulatory factor (Ser/Thr protein kinase)